MTASPEIAFSGDIACKLSYLLTDSDDESELSSVEEEKLEELMQELYKEITLTSSSSYNNTSPLTTVTSSLHSPSLSPLFSINDVKNSESCGASVSDSSASAMAGIEFVAHTGKCFYDVNVGLPEMGKGSPENELCVIGMEFNDNSRNNVAEAEEEMEMDGYDEVEVGGDQWLGRVLSWGPLEMEDWT